MLTRSARFAGLWALFTFAADAAELGVPHDFATIQSAIEAAATGDIIRVGPGKYIENLTFNGKNISVISSDGPSATILDLDRRLGISMGPGGDFAGFTVTNTASHTITVSGNGTVIRSNIFAGSSIGGIGGVGIEGNGASPLIEGNIFRNFRADDQILSGVISFFNTSSPHIINNVFADNPCRAITLTLPEGSLPVVANNTFARNAVAIRRDQRVNANLQIYRNNILYANDVGLQVDFGSATQNSVWENNLVFANGVDYSGIGNLTGRNGNFSGDPLFLSPSGDYRLTANSAAIDAGTLESAPDHDLEGSFRPIDGDLAPPAHVDIGAYEYTPGPPRPSTFLSASSIPEGAILNWADFDGSLAYQLSRATNLAGPFMIIGSGTFTPIVFSNTFPGPPIYSYVDTKAVLGLTNYYVVAGSNSFGIGPLSKPVSIRAGNRPPVALADTVELDEDTRSMITLPTSDPEGDLLQIEPGMLPQHGTLEFTSSNIVYYTPERDFSGEDRFGYSASDALGASSSNQIHLIIRPVNDPPSAFGETFGLLLDTETMFLLPASDIDSTNLSFSISVPPGRGVAFLDPTTGWVRYRPEHALTGVDVFRYQVFDGSLYSGEGTIVLSIIPPQDSDVDSIPDAWENFFDVNNPIADRDSDGSPNIAEYYAGTSPTDPGSRLEMIRVTLENTGVRVRWKSVGGTRYRVQSSDTSRPFLFLDIPRPAVEEIDPAPFSQVGENSFLDTRPLPQTGMRFYRIQALL